MIADDPAAIVGAVRALSAAHDHLFTSGGIGPTHDDITAEMFAALLQPPDLGLTPTPRMELGR